MLSFLWVSDAWGFETSWSLDINLASIHSEDTYQKPILGKYQYFEIIEGYATPVVGYEEKEFQNINPGLGLRYHGDENVDFTIGFFLNSFDDLSIYGAIEPHTSSKRLVQVGIMMGLATGYEDYVDHAAALTPFILPNMQFNFPTNTPTALKIGVLPNSIFGYNVDVLTFQLSIGI